MTDNLRDSMTFILSKALSVLFAFTFYTFVVYFFFFLEICFEEPQGEIVLLFMEMFTFLEVFNFGIGII